MSRIGHGFEVEGGSTVSAALLPKSQRKHMTEHGRFFSFFHRGVYGTPGSMPITKEKVAMFVAYMDSMGHAKGQNMLDKLF